MSSLNKGLGEFFTGLYDFNSARNEVSHRWFFAHVLDVIEDEFSIWYDGPDSIGAVRARILMIGYNKYEDEQDTICYPLDRSYLRVPFPGEQIMGVISFGPAVEGRYLARYYYWKVVTPDQNITYSEQPFTGTDPYHIKPGLRLTVDVNAEAKRFENKLPYDKQLLVDKSVNQKTRQGERTIESRFGAMIKFTSTPDTDTIWDASQINNQVASSIGDPLVVIGANPKTSTTKELITRDLQVDVGSNLFFATTQNLPIKIGCSKKLYSFNPDLRLGELSEATSNEVSLQTIFGGGFDPNQQLAIKLQGTITLPGGGGSTTPVDGINQEQSNNIKLANDTLKKAGYNTWQTRVAMLCVCGKESGLVPKSEYSYEDTGVKGLRHLFGKYLKKYDNDDQGLLEIRKNDIEFYDIIYGYKTTPARSGNPPNGGNDQPGDGFKYRGRGFNQITFKRAYKGLQDYAKTIGIDVDLINDPDRLNEPEIAAVGLANTMNNWMYKADRYKQYSGENVSPKDGTNLDVLIHWYANANAGMGNDWTSGVVTEAYNNAKAWENVLTNFFNANPGLM